MVSLGVRLAGCGAPAERSGTNADCAVRARDAEIVRLREGHANERAILREVSAALRCFLMADASAS